MAGGPETGCYTQFHFSVMDTEGRDDLPEPLGNDHHPFRRRLRQHNHKLLPAVSGDPVHFIPDVFCEGVINILENKVPDTMAVIVVNGLEIVYIHHEDVDGT